MFRFSSFISYIQQHPHYIGTFLKDIFKIWWWLTCRQPIVVITTESGGLGDYLWFRSYYNVIRMHYSPTKCRIIVIGMRQWEPLALLIDNSHHSNHFDIYRSFESPDHPLKIESLFFKLFKADVYVDFRALHLKHMVNARHNYFGLGFLRMKEYYETANNSVINQWFPLPNNFSHKPTLLPIKDKIRKDELSKPFVIIVEGGNTQGKISNKQLLTILSKICSFGHNILFNGDYQKLLTIISANNIDISKINIFDGYRYHLSEYPTIVDKCLYVVTVNTFIYHLAIQLGKPVIVMSVNEYESIKLDANNQMILFNEELQQAYENNRLCSYQPIISSSLKNIECKRISETINRMEESLC